MISCRQRAWQVSLTDDPGRNSFFRHLIGLADAFCSPDSLILFTLMFRYQHLQGCILHKRRIVILDIILLLADRWIGIPASRGRWAARRGARWVQLDAAPQRATAGARGSISHFALAKADEMDGLRSGRLRLRWRGCSGLRRGEQALGGLSSARPEPWEKRREA
jgi:hypothetical protein